MHVDTRTEQRISLAAAAEADAWSVLATDEVLPPPISLQHPTFENVSPSMPRATARRTAACVACTGGQSSAPGQVHLAAIVSWRVPGMHARLMGRELLPGPSPSQVTQSIGLGWHTCTGVGYLCQKSALFEGCDNDEDAEGGWSAA